MKLEKEEEREMEKRRKMEVNRPINPMSETLSRVKTVTERQYENKAQDSSASSKLLMQCCFQYTARACKGCCSVPQARVKLSSGQEARVKSC